MTPLTTQNIIENVSYIQTQSHADRELELMNSLGINTLETYLYEMDLSFYSDMYKDRNGFRPRHSFETYEELQNAIRELLNDD